MTDLSCPTCGAHNESMARFCAKCGTALPIVADPAAHPVAPPGAPTGWDLATATMTQEPAPGDPSARAPFERDDYATWGARFGGHLLDALIEGGILFGLAFLMGFFYAIVDPTGASASFGDPNVYGERPDSYFAFIGIWLLLALPTFVLWEVLWTRGKGMGKPGQRAAGFRVTTQTGERVSTGQAFGRASSKLIYLLSWLGLGPYIASAITIGVSKKHQAVHDLMSNTNCIKLTALRLRGMGPGTEGGIAPSAQPYFYSPQQSPQAHQTPGPPIGHAPLYPGQGPAVPPVVPPVVPPTEPPPPPLPPSTTPPPLPPSTTPPSGPFI